MLKGKKTRSSCASPLERFRSLAKRLLAVPKAEADKRKPPVTKKQSRPTHSHAVD